MKKGIIIGAVVLVGAAIYFFTRKKKTTTSTTSSTGSQSSTGSTISTSTTGTTTSPAPVAGNGNTPAPAGTGNGSSTPVGSSASSGSTAPVTNMPKEVTVSPLAVATIFQDDNYQGRSGFLKPGYYANAEELSAAGVKNDDASSVKLDPGIKIIMYEHSDRGGKKVEITSDTPSLSAKSFNDMMSSADVIAASGTLSFAGLRMKK